MVDGATRHRDQGSIVIFALGESGFFLGQVLFWAEVGGREEGDHGSLGQLGVEGSQLGELGLRLGAVEVNA